MIIGIIYATKDPCQPRPCDHLNDKTEINPIEYICERVDAFTHKCVPSSDCVDDWGGIPCCEGSETPTTWNSITSKCCLNDGFCNEGSDEGFGGACGCLCTDNYNGNSLMTFHKDNSFYIYSK